MNNPRPCPARIKRFLRKYLKESDRSKTLECLEENWKLENPKKKVQLTFSIVKPPSSRKIDITTKKKVLKKPTKDKTSESKSSNKLKKKLSKYLSKNPSSRRFQKDRKDLWSA